MANAVCAAYPSPSWIIKQAGAMILAHLDSSKGEERAGHIHGSSKIWRCQFPPACEDSKMKSSKTLWGFYIHLARMLNVHKDNGFYISLHLSACPVSIALFPPYAKEYGRGTISNERPEGGMSEWKWRFMVTLSHATQKKGEVGGGAGVFDLL